jgi:serine/threonine-protein kinase
MKLFGDRYQIGALVGAGGMSDVFVAKDQRLNREVALKVLRSDLNREQTFVTRFRKEAQAAASLSHPGIVAVYDSGETPAPYIVMELIQGKTLRDLITGPVDTKTAIQIAEGILQALAYSHANGIVHRDIKPGNIMITDQGDVKVMDFGIARALDDVSATMTATWNVVGTAQYLSPEQASGEVADARSDLYSVGCVLYEMLTGRPPFSGDTPVSIAFQHVSADLIPPGKVNPQINPQFDHFLSVVMAKDPANRYQDANAMLADLHRIRTGQTITTEIVRPRKKKNRIWQGIATLLALGLVAVGGFAITSRSGGVSGIEVPNVVGLTEPDATAQLGAFKIVVNHAHDSKIPVDRVASQSPLATSRAKKGSVVTITISDGPGDTVVPLDLVGMTLSDARDALASAGLNVSAIDAIPSDKPIGTVISVDPIAGSTIPAGSGVTLQIANGNIAVPNLVGQSAIQARTTLTQAGFLMREIYSYDANQQIGIVLAQAPEPGAQLQIGSQVTITINRQS